jgi:predicted amidohydrolase YtcJ
MATLSCALAAASVTLSLPVQADTRAADLVLKNGRIYTLEDQRPWTDAVAVRDGRFVAIGAADATPLIGPKTRVVDLQGAMAMPGINDVHAHPLDGAYEDLFACNFPPSAGLPQVLERVAACAARAEPGDWIVGAAFSSTLLPQLERADNLAALDRASGGHPVVLRDDTFHNRWVNTAVLKLAKLDASSVPPPGGFYVKDTTGRALSGLLKEFPAFHAIEQLMPARPAQRLRAAALGATQTLNGLGITTVQDAFASEQILRTWTALDREQGLSVRYVASLSGMPPTQEGDLSGLPLVDARETYRTAHVRPDFAKLFLDGVPPARTASMVEPYLPDAEHGAHYHGPSTFTLPQLVDMLTQLDKRGVPVKMHAAGDGSLRQALDAVAQVRRVNGPHGPRHQIAHASLIQTSDLARLKALNVVADISPMLWFPSGAGLAVQAAVGPERTERFFPVKSLLQAGALVAGGSDWPAGQPTANPWIGIEGLVTRRDPLKQFPGVLGADQAIDLATALRIYTRNSAEAMGLGAVTGSISLGKSADLIVLNQPLFEVPADRIHQTQVKQVFFEGRQVLPTP